MGNAGSRGGKVAITQRRDFFFQTSPSPFTSSKYDHYGYHTLEEGARCYFLLPKSTWELYISKARVLMSLELAFALKLVFPQYLQNLGVLNVTTESCPKPHVFYSFFSSTQGGARELPLSKEVATCKYSGGPQAGTLLMSESSWRVG